MGSISTFSQNIIDLNTRNNLDSIINIPEAKIELNESQHHKYDTLHSKLKKQLIIYKAKEDYFAAYYSLLAYFAESLDLDLLYDIVSASFEMSNFVSAMMNDDPNYVLSETNFDTFVNILQESAQNSESIDYKAIVASLVDEVQVYKSQNVQEIKSLLLTQ